MDVRHTQDVDLVFQLADRRSSPEAGLRLTEDLVAAIASTGRAGETVAGRALDECGVSWELVQALRRRAGLGACAAADATQGWDALFTVDAEQAAAAGRVVADELGQRFFGTEHLLIALIRDEGSGAARILRRLGVEPGFLAGRLAQLAPAAAVLDYALLDRFGRDLVTGERGKALPSAQGAGWQVEIDRIIRVATRMAQNNVLVLGLPPADPRAVVLALARGIASGDLAVRLVRERLYEIDMEAVLAASPAGEALRKTVRAIGLAARNRGNVLLCITGIDRYLHRGAEGKGPDTEEALRVAIAHGHLQILGTVADRDAAREILDNRPIGFRAQLVRVRSVAQ